MRGWPVVGGMIHISANYHPVNKTKQNKAAKQSFPIHDTKFQPTQFQMNNANILGLVATAIHLVLERDLRASVSRGGSEKVNSGKAELSNYAFWPWETLDSSYCEIIKQSGSLNMTSEMIRFDFIFSRFQKDKLIVSSDFRHLHSYLCNSAFLQI